MFTTRTKSLEDLILWTDETKPFLEGVQSVVWGRLAYIRTWTTLLSLSEHRILRSTGSRARAVLGYAAVRNDPTQSTSEWAQWFWSVKVRTRI